MCPECLISLCNKAWSQYVLDNEFRWPLEETFQFAILCDLENVFTSVGTSIQNCHKSMVSGYYTLGLSSVAGVPWHWSFWLEPHDSRFLTIWVLGPWKFCPDHAAGDSGLFSIPLNSLPTCLHPMQPHVPFSGQNLPHSPSSPSRTKV